MLIFGKCILEEGQKTALLWLWEDWYSRRNQQSPVKTEKKTKTKQMKMLVSDCMTSELRYALP